MTRLVLIVAFAVALPSLAQAGAWDELRQLTSIHAKAQVFNSCERACGTGGNAKKCCTCFGGIWFGTVKGGRCT